jgi:hypothetical protein
MRWASSNSRLSDSQRRDPSIVDDVGENGEPGPKFWSSLYFATQRILEDEKALADGARPASGREWGNLVATPLTFATKEILLRIGGMLLGHGVPPEAVYALMLVHNRAMSVTPMHPGEVQRLFHWLLRRHAERQQG